MSQLSPTPPTNTDRTSEVTTDFVSPAQISPADASQLLEIDAQPLMQNFRQAVQLSSNAPELFQSIFRIVAAETECLAMWRVQASSPDDALWISIENQLTDVVRKSESTDQICSATILPQRKHLLVAAPANATSAPTEPREFLAGCFVVSQQSSLRIQWLMGIASQSVDQWFLKHQTASIQSQSRSLNEALELISNIGNTETTTEAGITIANALRRLFKADQVAMAKVHHNKPTLLAISDVEKLDNNSACSALLKSAISQAINTTTTVTFPHADSTQPAANELPLKNWCQSNNAAAAINLPMKLGNGEIVGALLVTYSQSAPAPQLQDYLEKMTELIAQQFSIACRANRSTGELIQSKFALPKPTAKRLTLATIAVAALMAIPMPYRVKCDCQIQPIERRFVAAPYDGILEKSLVEIGELVSSDQVIARLEGRQLRIELAGLEAEYEGAKRRRDSSLAQREIAQSQIARSEMNRLSAEIELLNHRIQDLNVRSPITGVIVAGDMEKAQGAPLETGQTLFEVAPLETMVAEIGIPENEIQYIKKNDIVVLKINSFPFENWEGKLKQIHPSAEIVADQTVFVAEVEIDNRTGTLRPGMEGVAKISTRWSPIGWNLFHNAWESVRCWTIW
jgi:RND family efflux transporter MFP subunit